MSAAPDAQPMLEDVLLALQKTFSRLSSSTALRSTEEHKDKALAMIVGDVDFEIKLNVEPVPPPLSPSTQGGEKLRRAAQAKSRRTDAVSSSSVEPAPITFDHLRCRADGGGMALTLRGRVATDIRVKSPTPDETTQGDSK